jgi:hypothetical protein
MKINYTAGLHKVREAYFKWRNAHPYIKASVMSFTAGYNAALADIKANAQAKTELIPNGNKEGTGFPV